MLLTLFVGISSSVLADHWTPKTSFDYPHERALFVKVTTNGTDTLPSMMELAAFIDGDCRAHAAYHVGQRYELRVVGDLSKENNQTITFKACYQGLIYTFTDKSQKFVENGGSIELVLDTLQSITLPQPITHYFDNLSAQSNINLTDTIEYNFANNTGTSTLDAGQLTFMWDNYGSDAYFSVDNNTNILTSTGVETPDEGSPLVLYVNGLNENLDPHSQPFATSINTMVKIKQTVFPVTSITLQPATVTMQVGEDVSAKLKELVTVTVLPNNASNPETIWGTDPQEAEWFEMSNMQVTTPGTWKIIYSSVSNPEITATLTVNVPTPVSFTIPNEVTLSKLRDVTVNFTNFTGDNFDVNLIQFNATAFPANSDTPFTATRLTDDGMSWSLRGKYVGNWPFEVTYNGKRMETTNGSDQGTAYVDAEVALPTSGWEWISFNYVPSNGYPYSLAPQGKYLPFLNIDENNRVIEMRSQWDLLYNDPTEGFFGGLNYMHPDDGMYKVRATYNDGTSNIINLGPDATPASESGIGGLLEIGYNWITFPYEYDLTLEELPSLNTTSHDGDMIIGRTTSASYDTSEGWVSGDGFKFEAGKGYIYFTEQDGADYPLFTFAGIPACYQATPNPVKGQFVAGYRFAEKRDGFADNMPVIACIEGLSNPEDYVLGAFVGDECRGQGTVGVRDIMMLSVSGRFGEKVQFRLMNKATGETIMTNETISYSQRRGTLKAPLQLTSDVVTGIHSPKTVVRESSEIYNLSGQRLTAPRKGINIVNGKKVLY